LSFEVTVYRDEPKLYLLVAKKNFQSRTRPAYRLDAPFDSDYTLRCRRCTGWKRSGSKSSQSW
jgi:hypothetical protein